MSNRRSLPVWSMMLVACPSVVSASPPTVTGIDPAQGFNTAPVAINTISGTAFDNGFFPVAEDFETLSLGSLNGQNGWTATSQWNVQNSVVYQGSEAIYAVAPSGGTFPASRFFAPMSDGILHCAVRRANSNNHSKIGFYNGGSYAFQLQLNGNNDQFGWHDSIGGERFPGIAVNYGTWQTVDIQLNLEGYGARFRIDGGAWTQWYTTSSQTQVTELRLWAEDPSGDLYVDDIRGLSNVKLSKSGQPDIIGRGFSPSNAWTFAENLEDGYNLASLNGQRGWTGVNATVQGSIVYDGSRAVAISSNDNDGAVHSVNPLTLGTYRVAVRRSAIGDTSGTSGFQVSLCDGGSIPSCAYVAIIQFSGDGYIKTCSQEGCYVPFQAFSPNVWYLVDMEFNTNVDQFRLRVDGGAWSAWLGSYGGDRSAVTLVRFQQNGNGSATNYFDAIQPAPSDLAGGTFDITGAAAGYWDVTVTNPDGLSGTLPQVFLVRTPCEAPQIVADPGSDTVCAGDAANFSVTASGDAPLACQWRKDGGDLAGQTAPTLSIPSATVSDAGSYDCAVTNACGSATSGAADLVVLGGGDCNTNGTPDECDIYNGATDCNGNNLPDECEPDCNTNGVADGCDISNGAQDCNGNSVPDECDLAYGTTNDCNGDVYPDECQDSRGGVHRWTAASDENFYNDSNWDPYYYPSDLGQALFSNVTPDPNRCVIDNFNGTAALCSVLVESPGGGRQTLQVNPNTTLWTRRGTNVSTGGELSLRAAVLAGGPLSNASNAVHGYGRIETDVSNQGTIEGQSGYTLEITGATLDNQAGGTLQAPFWSFVHVQSSTVEQGGVMRMRPGAGMLFDSPLTNAMGGWINLLGGMLGAPGITNAGGGSISGFGTIDSSITNNGGMTITADTQIIGDVANTGTITLQSGLLTVTGTLSGSGTLIGGFGGRDGEPRDNGFTILGDYDLGPDGALMLQSGTFRLGGDFHVAVNDWRRFDMSTSTLQLIGLPQNAPQEIEVMAENVSGCSINLPDLTLFNFRKFRVGPTATGAKLVDNFDNSSGFGAEAMYVQDLVLDPGTSLDVAGLWLYYLNVTPADPYSPTSGVRIIDSVGGGGVMSANTNAPVITVHPIGQEVCSGGACTLSVTVAGAPPINYQWRQDGVLLPSANAPTLIINPVSASDTGNYDVVVFNDCGLAVSDSAIVNVWGATAGDVNNDTRIDGRDVAAFISALLSIPNGPQGQQFCAADITADGIIDAADVPPLVALLLTP